MPVSFGSVCLFYSIYLSSTHLIWLHWEQYVHCRFCQPLWPLDYPLLCLACSRVRCSLTIGSVTWCHSGLCHKCCQKTSAHQTQWVMTSGDGDRWARDMMMTLSAVWDHKKPHGSENSYQPILTANCPASSLPKNANWRVAHD